jgi:serine/threonine protein phosphatase 1
MSRYVIGDIHGCAEELRRLIDALPLRGGDSVVFLGDYIDRGPDSAAVVAYLISLRQQLDGIEWVFLKGNHEDMFLSYLGLDGQHGDMFLINGGKATLASYGVAPDQFLPAQAFEAIPVAHVRFYKTSDGFVFVRACRNPPTKALDGTNRRRVFLDPQRVYLQLTRSSLHRALRPYAPVHRLVRSSL